MGVALSWMSRASLAVGLCLVAGCLDVDAAPTGGACTNTCRYAGDGECDDGGEGALYDLCALGTDCNDCGPRGSGPPPMEEGECPGGCASDEACVRDIGCLPLCSGPSECASGCCAPLESGRMACADARYCDGRPPDPGGTPATLSSTTPTAPIPNAEACSGSEASASGDLVAINTPLVAEDTRVESFTARYEMERFIGEPTRRAAFAWQGTGSLGSVVWAAEVLTADGTRQYVTAGGQRVYASWTGGTIGDPGEGFGFDTTGSPSWDETFVTYDGSAFGFGVSEDEAQRIYGGCFRLGELRVLEINGDPALRP